MIVDKRNISGAATTVSTIASSSALFFNVFP